jgi:hypothetical protein
MLELMHPEETNSSIHWKLEIHNSYFADIWIPKDKF